MAHSAGFRQENRTSNERHIELTTVTWNGTTYYYAINGQGDVIGIFDVNGDCVVTYNWDNAWGYNPEPDGPMADTLGTLNPLRYRSYVYDEETGYYYLQSRYYDPEICRFINADNYPATGQGLTGNNMFAYCGNNPVNREDDGGNFWNFVVGAAVGALIGAVTTVVDAVSEGGVEALASGKTWAKIGVSVACGAINGTVAASGAHIFIGGLVGSATGFVESLSHELIDNDGKMSADSWSNVGIDTAVGFLGGLAGGHGAMHGNKYMSQQTTRLAKHITTDGLKKAGSFYLKMTVNYSKQFVKPTLYGLAKGWLGGKAADYGFEVLLQ